MVKRINFFEQTSGKTIRCHETILSSAENSAVTPDIFLAGFTFIREGRRPFLAFVVAMVVVITDFLRLVTYRSGRVVQIRFRST